MSKKQKLANPIFIAAVVALLVNDWYLKYTFHNQATGKLSDVAGLFAFPFFLSALWPKRRVIIYIGTLIWFILWKSPLIQPLIDVLSHAGIPVNRVVDFSDYWALMILPLSLLVFNIDKSYSLKPFLLNGVMAIAALSFVATSMPKGKYTKFTGINKTYSFDISKRELVSRLNALQLEEVKYIENLVLNRNNTKYMLQPDTARIDFDSKTNIFYYSTTYSKKDTIARLLDYREVNNTDTIKLRTIHSDINISGDDKHSEIKLLSLMNYVQLNKQNNAQERAVSFFEKFVIKKIRKYGK